MEQREEQALEDTQSSWLRLQGCCNYHMLSPWCTVLQEHVARNYGFFSSIKAQASTHIMLTRVCIISPACDQIRAPLYLCTKVVPDTPSCLIGGRVCGRCGKGLHGLRREWKPWGGGESALFMLFMASSPRWQEESRPAGDPLFRWQESVFSKASSVPPVVG